MNTLKDEIRDVMWEHLNEIAPMIPLIDSKNYSEKEYNSIIEKRKELEKLYNPLVDSISEKVKDFLINCI